jgi:hypothetical protein
MARGNARTGGPRPVHRARVLGVARGAFEARQVCLADADSTAAHAAAAPRERAVRIGTTRPGDLLQRAGERAVGASLCCGTFRGADVGGDLHGGTLRGRLGDGGRGSRCGFRRPRCAHRAVCGWCGGVCKGRKTRGVGFAPRGRGNWRRPAAEKNADTGCCHERAKRQKPHGGQQYGQRRATVYAVCASPYGVGLRTAGHGVQTPPSRRTVRPGPTCDLWLLFRRFRRPSRE